MPKIAAALLGLFLFFLPGTALAADGSSLQNQATGGSSSLGPAAASGQSGSSSADSASLQPAGTSPLQSTTSDSGGLTAPSSNTLQAPATGNDALQVISGDADGAPHQTSGATQWWMWLGFSLLFGLIAAAAVWFWRRRDRRPRRVSKLKPAGDANPNPAASGEPTTSQRLSITINRPANVVFEFSLNPKNTPLWVDTIQEEHASDTPPRLGTIYRNRNANGDWSEYEVTHIHENESFEMHNRQSGYRVRYTFTPDGNDATHLEYYESVEDGHIEHPFTGAELEKLKAAIERPPSNQPTDKSPHHAKHP